MRGWHIGWALASICFAATTAALGVSQDRAVAQSSGVVVDDVPGGSAGAKGGVTPNDHVLTYDAKSVSSPWSLQAAEDNTIDKTEIVLTVQRAGRPVTLTVPRGALGIRTRPSVSDDVQALIEAGKSAEAAKKLDDAISSWT